MPEHDVLIAAVGRLTQALRAAHDANAEARRLLERTYNALAEAEARLVVVGAAVEGVLSLTARAPDRDTEKSYHAEEEVKR